MQKGLIRKIGETRLIYTHSGMSDLAISSIIARDGVRDDYLEFLALEEGRVYFGVKPKQAWDENTAKSEVDIMLRNRFNRLNLIGTKRGLTINLSSNGFIMYGPSRSGSLLAGQTLDVATIHPDYLVFNLDKSHEFGLRTFDDRDQFLSEIVEAAYR